MITEQGKIKCDACGKFVKKEDWVTEFTPDSEYSHEQQLDFHRGCNPPLTPRSTEMEVEQGECRSEAIIFVR